MPEGTEPTTTTTTPEGGGDKDAAYWQAEAKKAFEARDKAKHEAQKLRESGLTPEAAEEYRALKANAEKAEEERKRKAGEFDSLRAEMVKKHETELASERKAREAAEQALSEREVRTAFAQASDWFGPNGKSILPPEVAQDWLGKYCTVEGGRVIVHRQDGSVIHGRDGTPAEFSEAMAELIQTLPKHTQDAVLRGSGKTGSGATGGALGAEDDIETLTKKVRAGVKGADEALRRKLDSGSRIVSGRAFQAR